jgi:hypothetical protein
VKCSIVNQAGLRLTICACYSWDMELIVCKLIKEMMSLPNEILYMPCMSRDSQYSTGAALVNV